MVKKTFLVLICFIGLIIFISTLHGQGSKKTITLPSGEVVCDLNGEWDAFIELYGPIMSKYGNYPQIEKITQTGSSFVAIRMIDDPYNLKGSQSLQGELDKSGSMKVTILSFSGGSIEAKGQISDDGNKIVIDSGIGHRWTLTRK
jgi:hypothetical protein